MTRKFLFVLLLLKYLIRELLQKRIIVEKNVRMESVSKMKITTAANVITVSKTATSFVTISESNIGFVAGYTGTLCEINVDDCEGMNCNNGRCQDGNGSELYGRCPCRI